MEQVPSKSPFSEQTSPPFSPSVLPASEMSSDLNKTDLDDSKKSEEEKVEYKGPEFMAEDGFRVVGVYIGCEKLNNINVVTQSFGCSFKVGMMWQATKNDFEKWNEDEKSFVPSWVPRFEMPNVLSLDLKEMEQSENNPTGFRLLKEGDIDNWGMAVTNLRVPWVNVCTYTIEGTFSEEFEIERFPMDTQDLQVSILSRQPLDQCAYMPSLSRDEVTADLDLKYGDHDEYDFHPPIMEYDKVQWDEDGYGRKVYYATATLRLKMSRKWMIHIWKIGFSAFFITLSSLIGFTFDHLDDLDARVGHIFTMLLTMVAFQFIVQQKLPAISYLTRMDQYMLFAMFFLFLVALVVAFNGMFEVTTETDHLTGFVLLGFLIISNIIFCIRLYFDRRIEEKKLTMTGPQMEEFDKQYGKKDKKGDDDEEEDDPYYFEVSKKEIYVNEMIKTKVDKDLWDDVLPGL